MSRDSLDSIAVIIPCAPGETSWRQLNHLWQQLPAGSQVVLVGPEAPPPRSLYATSEPPRSDLRWSFVCSPLGRAVQLNAGAKAAVASHANILWFVHADSVVPPGAVAAVQEQLRKPHGLAFFDLHFQADGPMALRLNAAGARWRSRVLGLPFGDQALAIRAADFEAVGGFPEVAAGEDHAFVWRCRRAGLELRPTGKSVATSGRKYARDGWGRTTQRHLWMTLRQAVPEFRSYVEERWLGKLSAVSPRSSKRPG